MACEWVWEKLPESLSQPQEETWGPPCWVLVFTLGTSSCTELKGVAFQTWSDRPLSAVLDTILLEAALGAAHPQRGAIAHRL